MKVSFETPINIGKILDRLDLIEERLNDLEMKVEAINEAADSSFGYLADDICEIRRALDYEG